MTDYYLVLILVLMDNQNTILYGRLRRWNGVLILVLMDNQNTHRVRENDARVCKKRLNPCSNG